MKSTILSMAVLALLGSAQSVMIRQSNMSTIQDSPFDGDDFAQCTADGFESIGFDSNVAGLYESSDVRLLDGHDAKRTLISGFDFKYPILVVAYHPQCPHCHTMVADFKQLATEAKKDGTKVEIAAINMSADHTSKKLDIEAFPTVRYYGKAGEFEKYHDPAGRHYKGFKHFLELKGFKFEEAKAEAKKEEVKKPAALAETKTEVKVEAKVETKAVVKVEEKKQEVKAEVKK